MLPAWLWILLGCAISAYPWFTYGAPVFDAGTPLLKLAIIGGMIVLGMLWGALGVFTRMVRK